MPILVNLLPDPDFWIEIGTCSHRQIRAALEGLCPDCGSDDLERSDIVNRWARAGGWGVCNVCLWAAGFAVDTGPYTVIDSGGVTTEIEPGVPFLIRVEPAPVSEPTGMLTP